MIDLPVDAIRKRRSVRKYQETPLSDEQIKEVLDVARYAPSWANQQGWEILIVKDKEQREKVARILEGNPAQRAVTQAPVLLVICADPGKSGKQLDKEYYMADASLLLDHIMLEAADMGLGTVYIGLFDEDKVREILGVPQPYRIVGMTPLGIPEKMPKERPRRELDEMLHWETW